MKFVFFVYCLIIISSVSLGQTDSSAENIFIITTDGFRWQEVFTGADSGLIANSRYVEDTALLKESYWDPSPELRRQKLMPFFWNTIARQGQLYGNRLYENKVDVTNFYKISYPGYNEMLTGYADPVFIPNVPIRNRNINILEYLNSREQYAGKVAAFSSWNVFSAILNEKRSRLPLNSGYMPLPDDSSLNNAIINASQDGVLQKKNTRYDLLTYLGAREYIEHNHPKVVLIGFGETDEFAHMGRYDLYLQQATQVDRMIAELWYYVQTSSFYRNKTTFIITTDHGRGRRTSAWYKHGILTSGSGETWFAVIGPGILPEGEIKYPQQSWQKQIAPLIARLLGEQFGEVGSARSIDIPRTTGYNANIYQRTSAVLK
jgi:hypothetical protein